MSKYVLARTSMACAALLILPIVMMPTITNFRLDPTVKHFVEFVVETVTLWIFAAMHILGSVWFLFWQMIVENTVDYVKISAFANRFWISIWSSTLQQIENRILNYASTYIFIPHMIKLIKASYII